MTGLRPENKCDCVAALLLRWEGKQETWAIFFLCKPHCPRHFPLYVDHHAGAVCGKSRQRSPETVAVDEVGGSVAEERDCPSQSVLVPLAAEITFQMDLGHLPFQK